MYDSLNWMLFEDFHNCMRGLLYQICVCKRCRCYLLVGVEDADRVRPVEWGWRRHLSVKPRECGVMLFVNNNSHKLLITGKLCGSSRVVGKF